MHPNTEHITQELVEATARAPYEGPDSPCPWDSVAPLTQFVLKSTALEFFKAAIPVLIEHGWTPPTEGDQA